MKYVILAALLLSLFGCDVVGIGHSTGRAYLGDSGAAIHFVVPDTVIRGNSFQVEFAYYGSGSCTELDHIEKRVSGNVATLDPITRSPRGVDCTADLRRFVASTPVQFINSGTAEVRLRGEFGRGDTVVVRRTFVK